MKKLFYSRLAVNNIKKNSKTYMPYIISSIVTVMMFYIMLTLSQDAGLDNMFGGRTVKSLLGMGVYVIGIFAAIFLFYSNSFLIKRRKKEFGLFNILGMEKRHISRIVAIETGVVFVGCTGLGIVLGIVFSKIVQLAMFKLLHMGAMFGFQFSLQNILVTAAVFFVVYLLIFLSSMWQIHLSNPIDLLKGGQVGEREPKTRWISAVLGAICLGTAYYIALTVESPLAAVMLFFVAVILVIVGTELLFVAGSTALLKLLRNNKRFYYKPNHFISVSGMIYRMKQNAVGLANICILSTMVLVMISSTVSLYIGSNDALDNSIARDIMIYNNESSTETSKYVDDQVKKITSSRGIKMSNILDYNATVVMLTNEGNTFFPIPGGIQASNAADFSKIVEFGFMTVDEYNRITGDNQSLAHGHALLYVNDNETYNSIKLYDTNITIDGMVKDLPVDTSMGGSVAGTKKYYIIMKDYAAMDALSDDIDTKFITGIYAFDVDCDADEAKLLVENISQVVSFGNQAPSIVNKFENLQDNYSMYGGLLFLGIFLGILFIMATVQIIYYKQISEGHEDRERFIIMQNVGMNRTEVKQSIRSQVLTVFFLPLIVAGVHIAFAFSIITKLLAILWLTNTVLFAICTVATFLVFAVFYAVVYAMTARTYYKIVEAKPL